MDNIKNDDYYASQICKDIEFVLKHTDQISLEGLEDNEILTDSVLFRLSQITENLGKLSDDFKNTHCDIPWNFIRGMRNRIVHDYGGVDLEKIYDTVKNDLPKLLNEFKK